METNTVNISLDKLSEMLDGRSTNHILDSHHKIINQMIEAKDAERNISISKARADTRMEMIEESQPIKVENIYRDEDGYVDRRHTEYIGMETIKKELLEEVEKEYKEKNSNLLIEISDLKEKIKQNDRASLNLISDKELEYEDSRKMYKDEITSLETKLEILEEAYNDEKENKLRINREALNDELTDIYKELEKYPEKKSWFVFGNKKNNIVRKELLRRKDEIISILKNKKAIDYSGKIKRWKDISHDSWFEFYTGDLLS